MGFEEWRIWAFLLAAAWALRPVATFLHEMGHAFPALLLTTEPVQVLLGASFEKPLLRLGRLGLAHSFKRGFSGFTDYDRRSLGKGALLAVIAGGPLASALGAGVGAWTLYAWEEVHVWRVAGAAFLLVNGIVFLKSAVPAVLRGNQDFPEGGLSDGLDFWRVLRR